MIETCTKVKGQGNGRITWRRRTGGKGAQQTVRMMKDEEDKQQDEKQPEPRRVEDGKQYQSRKIRSKDEEDEEQFEKQEELRSEKEWPV